MTRNLVKRLLASALAATILAIIAQAQPKALGAVQSYRGFWVSYEHSIAEDCFIGVDAGVLMTDIYSGEVSTPGFSAELKWNLIFFRKEIPESGEFRAFAGPGLTVGYSTDFHMTSGYGPFFGICGNIGVECIFSRGLTLSATVLPTIGSRIMIYEESAKMVLYRNGLIYGLVPQIGIKYNF
ncbi:MAG: hypothetical protein ACI3ZL_02685 [Candidatus Cryptobacteroides sp.]